MWSIERFRPICACDRIAQLHLSADRYIRTFLSHLNQLLLQNGDDTYRCDGPNSSTSKGYRNPNRWREGRGFQLGARTASSASNNGCIWHVLRAKNTRIISRPKGCHHPLLSTVVLYCYSGTSLVEWVPIDNFVLVWWWVVPWSQVYTDQDNDVCVVLPMCR